MECKFCKCDTFIGHQIIRADVLVSGQNGSFYGNMPNGLETAIYDSGSPYGSFQCCGCGAVFDELNDKSEPVSGPIDGWSWSDYNSMHYIGNMFVDWERMDFISDTWAKQYFGSQVKGKTERDEGTWYITISQLKHEHENKIAALFETYDIEKDYGYQDEWDDDYGVLLLPTSLSNRVFAKILQLHIGGSYANYDGVTFLQSLFSLQMFKMQGDIWDSGADIYIQQVNCCGVMGMELVEQVKLKYPEVYGSYQALCLEKGNDLLGSALISRTNDGHYIANCFVQANSQKTDYGALSSSLRQVRKFAEQNDLDIALPYGLGSGQSCREWLEILQIITDIFAGYSKVCIWER